MLIYVSIMAFHGLWQVLMFIEFIVCLLVKVEQERQIASEERFRWERERKKLEEERLKFEEEKRKMKEELLKMQQDPN